MITIRQAMPEDIPIIQTLTRVIWPAAYSTILSQEQISYMIHLMYSSNALLTQMTTLKHTFLLAYDDNEPVGFASFSETKAGVFKLHKLYVLPTKQGIGVGRQLVNEVIVRISGASALELNVNRHNPAVKFYERLGFRITREEDIDIGSGYWMNDYVMRRELPANSGKVASHREME